MSGTQSRESQVVLFDTEGRQTRELDLTPLLSSPDHLEVQDFRYHAGRVYFNEACQSYSREAGGRCSALVCADLDTGRVLWRTAPLVSNNIFIIYRNRVFCGYGFTAEPGEIIGVIGGTGSGKTTLVGLIPRFYDASSGTIRVLGRDINALSPVEMQE